MSSTTTKKRLTIVCNRCTVEFFSVVKNDSTASLLYCDECLSDFIPCNSNMDASNSAIPSNHKEADEQSDQVIVITEDDDTEMHMNTSCLFCDMDLSHLQTEQCKEEHIRYCIESWQLRLRVHDGNENECNDATFKDTESSGLWATVYYCVICDMDISKKGLLNRAFHLKKCAKENKIATKDLLSLLEPIVEPIDLEDDNEDGDDGDPQPEAASSSSSSSSSTSISNGLSKDKASPQKNAWEVMMAASAKSITTGFTKNVDSRTRSLSVSASSSSFGLGTRTITTANTTTTTTTMKPEKSFKRPNRWSSSGNRSGDDQPPQYVPAFKKVQAPNMTHPVIVDGFQYASKSLSDCYFLTHFHSDHYTGLTRSFSHGTEFMYTVWVLRL